MLEAGRHKLTLNGLTLDGENKTCEDFQGIINAGKGSTLTLEEVTIQNFNAYRILRTIEADEASLTNVTIKDNTSEAGRFYAFPYEMRINSRNRKKDDKRRKKRDSKV